MGKYNAEYFKLNNQLVLFFKVFLIINIILSIIGLVVFVSRAEFLYSILFIIYSGISIVPLFSLKRLLEVQEDQIMRMLKLEKYLLEKDGEFENYQFVLSDKKNELKQIDNFEYIPIDKEKIIQLSSLMNDAKKIFSSKSNSDDVINLINSFERNKNKGLSMMKYNLSYFIDCGIIGAEEPYRLIK